MIRAVGWCSLRLDAAAQPPPGVLADIYKGGSGLMRKRVLLSMCLLLIAALPVQAQQKTSLIFTAGPTGGSWTPMAAATAETIKKKFPEIDVQVEPGAALVNIEKMRSDKADLGWSMTTVLADARAGHRHVEGQADRQAAVRGQLLPERVAARGAPVRRHPQVLRPQGQGGGAAPARQHEPVRRVGAAREDRGHEARGPRHAAATARSPRTPRRSATGRPWRWAGTRRCRRASCSTSARR